MIEVYPTSALYTPEITNALAKAYLYEAKGIRISKSKWFLEGIRSWLESMDFILPNEIWEDRAFCGPVKVGLGEGEELLERHVTRMRDALIPKYVTYGTVGIMALHQFYAQERPPRDDGLVLKAQKITEIKHSHFGLAVRKHEDVRLYDPHGPARVCTEYKTVAESLLAREGIVANVYEVASGEAEVALATDTNFDAALLVMGTGKTADNCRLEPVKPFARMAPIELGMIYATIGDSD